MTDPNFDFKRCAVNSDMNGTSWDIAVEWAVDDGTHFPCGITIALRDRHSKPPKSGALSPNNIRRLNFRAIFAAARQPDALRATARKQFDEALLEQEQLESALASGHGTREIADLEAQLVEHLSQLHDVLATPVGPHRGTPITDAQLEHVASIYKQAKATNQPVTQAVADAFHISVSTAGKRILKARNAGLLPPVKEAR